MSHQILSDFLQNAKQGKIDFGLTHKLSLISANEFEDICKTEASKLSFYLNLYNALIIVEASKNKQEFNKNKYRFFTKKVVCLLGKNLSFNQIEHGLIRKSQWVLGLGYVSCSFPNNFEKRFRMKSRDFRIHFALNCGAVSCPPITVYNATILEEQLQTATSYFLLAHTTYNSHKNKVYTSKICAWYLGDFGGKKGVLSLLKEVGAVPKTHKLKLSFNPYNWKLSLNNFKN